MLKVRANREIPKTLCQVVVYWMTDQFREVFLIPTACPIVAEEESNLVFWESFTPRGCLIEDITAPLRPEAVLHALPGRSHL